jgi:hypothetical protein
MAKVSLRQGCASGLALSAALALWLGCAGSPALAGDDGAAPIWDSFGSVFTLGGGDKNEKPIEYRDQPRLVLPQKMELPPPASAPSVSATDWPRDPDIERAKREKAEKNTFHKLLLDPANINSQPKYPTGDSVVTTSYTAGMGPSDRRCSAGPGQTCDDAGPPKPVLNWNPLTWVGLQKKPQTVLGPEPERTSLTDPPVGYRAPIEGPGTKVDN